MEDTRTKYDAIQSIDHKKRQIARKVFSWRLRGGSRINEPDVEEAPLASEIEVDTTKLKMYAPSRRDRYAATSAASDGKGDAVHAVSERLVGKTKATNARPSREAAATATSAGKAEAGARAAAAAAEEEEEEEEVEEPDPPPIRTLKRREEEWSWRWQGGVYGLYSN